MTQTSYLLYMAYQFANPPEPKQYKATRDIVTDVVCKFFNLQPSDLANRSRRKHLVEARQIYCYLMRKYTTESLKMIAETIGQDHTTVIHSNDKVQQVMTVEVEYSVMVAEIERMVRTECNIHLKNKQHD